MNPDWNRPELCNVAGALSTQAREQPDAPAVHYPTRKRGAGIEYASCRYRQLDELSDAYARGLASIGIGRGTRTALMVPPGLEFIALFFSLFKAGAVPVLIDPGIGLKPLRHCLAEAEPEAFIGTSKAQLARKVLGWARGSVRKSVTIGPRLGWGGISSNQLKSLGDGGDGPVLADTRPEEMAAILFTSGSTGIPKGVVYRHRHFASQVEMLRNTFDIKPGEVDLATFPPFALFDPALGMSTVVPWMDPTRPARAKPEHLLQAIEQFGVTNIFGSPALLKVLSTHTQQHGLKLPTVRRVISAGAAVPLATIRRMQDALPGDAAVHTPYGATECLPVASISSHDLDAGIEERTLGGAGICVGKIVPPNRVAIIPISDLALETFSNTDALPALEAGEIVVHGPTATDSYWRRDEQTRLAKMQGPDGNWHRMGDIGYLDEEQRLWYCGRKSQRIRMGDKCLFADQLEAVFNAHHGVERSALVGVGGSDNQTPVLIVETRERNHQRIRSELLGLAGAHPKLGTIRDILFHPDLPVDIRHNSKINREKLAKWATGKLK